MATLHQCERAIERYQDELMELPNVVGLGITTAKTISKGGRSRSEHAVAVYVSKKVPKRSLDPDHLIPKVLRVTTVGKKRQVRTRVIETGEFRPEEQSGVTKQQGFGKEAL